MDNVKKFCVLWNERDDYFLKNWPALKIPGLDSINSLIMGPEEILNGVLFRCVSYGKLAYIFILKENMWLIEQGSLVLFT